MWVLDRQLTEFQSCTPGKLVLLCLSPCAKELILFMCPADNG